MITAALEAGSSLLLEPAYELRFTLDRSRLKARSVLTLSNVAVEGDVAFKVRTRNPDVFAVKPTHGVIRPGESAQVSLSVAPRSVARLVKMQPRDLEARLSSDLFLIQSVELTPDMRLATAITSQDEPPSSEQLRAFWKQVPRELVDENKLACRFLVGRGGPQPAATSAKPSSFMSASASLAPDLTSTARESFVSQSTVYGDCFSELGDADQADPQRSPNAAPQEEERDRQLHSDRLSFASVNSMSSTSVRHEMSRNAASPTSADLGGCASSSALNRENLRRLSNASSWVTAACGSPTNSAVSAGTTAYDDCRSMTSTMLDTSGTMLSARSVLSTAEGAARVAPEPPTPPTLLFSIHPHDVLQFALKRAPRYWSSSSFFIVNASQTDCLAFKVRTTNQDGYFVQPSRGLVSVTSAHKVEVHLCAPREGFVDRARREAKDAFLVEVAAVSRDQFRELEALDARQRSRELSSLWSVLPPNDRSSEMLTVELTVDPEDEDDVCTPVRQHVVAMGKPPSGLGRSRRVPRNKPAPGESTQGDDSRPGMQSATPKPQSVVVMSPDAMDLIDFSDPDVSFFV